VNLSPIPLSVRTTCPYCGVGCGVQAAPGDDGAVSISISGDAAHPANAGRLCVKGASLGDTLGLEGRLLQHTMTRTGKAAQLTSHVAESFIDIHPQDALKFGVREGELARVSSQ